jgi:hypothetical protein
MDAHQAGPLQWLRGTQAHVRAVRFRLWRARDSVRHWLRGSRHVAETFARIYERNLWGDPESVSGSGSSATSTVAIRAELPELLLRLEVKTLIDAPCGDFNWIKELAGNLDNYVGIDVVEALVERNRRSYETDRVRFLRADITADALPRGDAILCRDCFIHLPTRMIVAALDNFKASGARYLLLTNQQGAVAYHDIPVGAFRPIDFRAPPFLFPAPSHVIREATAGRELCLWEMTSLPLGSLPR